MRNDSFMRKRHPGFTLLELLVIVVIITVLLAVLIPALSQAKRTSGRAACGAQLHGLGVGVRTYLDENNSLMPFAAMVPSVNSNQYPPIPVAMAAQIPMPRAWKCNADNLGETRDAAYANPAAPYGSLLPTGTNFPAWFDGETTSYAFNLSLAGQRVERFFLYNTLHDTGTFVLWDFDAFHAEKGQIPSKNILYADGHVSDVTDITDVNGQGQVKNNSSPPPS